MGEAYTDGWWDANALDEFFARVRRVQLYKKVGGWYTTWLALKSRVLNLQSKTRSNEVADHHYDLGNGSLPGDAGSAYAVHVRLLAWRDDA